MGANRFYDYLLLHKYLGIREMVSLEHDPIMFERAVFSVPYKFIDVRNSSAADFIQEDTCSGPSIFWLDYDGGLGQPLLGDVASLSVKLKIGDFCFVTVYGGVPRQLEGQNAQTRLVWFQDTFNSLAGDITIEDMQNSRVQHAIHKILVAAFRNAFAPRRDGDFITLLQVQYSDSKPMITVGGAFLTEGQAFGYRSLMRSAMPFLNTTGSELYEIRSLHLTERERTLFDRAVTGKTSRSKERNSLRKIGFEDSDLSAYKDLLRYLPRYVETIV
jgi:hypothetical protein